MSFGIHPLTAWVDVEHGVGRAARPGTGRSVVSGTSSPGDARNWARPPSSPYPRPLAAGSSCPARAGSTGSTHRVDPAARDRLAELEVVDVGAELLDPAHALVTDLERQLPGDDPGRRVEEEEVAVAQPNARHLDQDLVGGRRGDVDLAELQRHAAPASWYTVMVLTEGQPSSSCNRLHRLCEWTREARVLDRVGRQAEPGGCPRR